MLRMADCGVVVANYSRELRTLRGREGIYFAGSSYARGILEGIRHFGFDRSSA
jgi:sucrose-phosphate synthase